MKKALITLSIVTLLTGCKVELAPIVNLSDINSESAKTVQSKLIVEVMSCKSYEDSRQESSDVKDAKEAIAKVFNNAKYIECYTEKMDSKALFEIPITVGGKNPVDGIQITNTDIGGGMVIKMSDNLKQNFERQKKASFIDINPLIKITINNDINKDQDIVVHGVLANNKTYLPYSWYNLKANENQTFKLSDISVSSLIENGNTLVYEDFDKRIEITKPE